MEGYPGPQTISDWDRLANLVFPASTRRTCCQNDSFLAPLTAAAPLAVTPDLAVRAVPIPGKRGRCRFRARHALALAFAAVGDHPHQEAVPLQVASHPWLPSAICHQSPLQAWIMKETSRLTLTAAVVCLLHAGHFLPTLLDLDVSLCQVLVHNHLLQENSRKAL